MPHQLNNKPIWFIKPPQTQGVNLLYAVDTEAVANATEKVSCTDIPADLVNVLGAIKALGNQQPRVTG
jgi:hypothetical protein